jgi:hypothetical protein
MFLHDDLQVWIVGSPNDRIAANAVLNSLGENLHKVRDLTARTDLGTAIDLLSTASLVISNDSGLMHAAAAGGRAAGCAVRLVVAALYAADFTARQDRQDRHRVQPLLPARMSARPFQVHA